MDSSIYRRDVNGRIFGTDESNPRVEHQVVADQSEQKSDVSASVSQQIEPEVAPRINPVPINAPRREPEIVPPIAPKYPNSQSPIIQRPPIPSEQPAKPKLKKPKFNVALMKSDLAKIDWSKFKNLETFKKLIVGDKKSSTSSFGKVTYYAKRILVFYIVFFVFLGLKTSFGLNKIDATPEFQVENSAGTNWLLIGSDSREGLTPEEEQQLHTGQDEGAQRTDTIMIVHIGKDGVTLVSLPRDSYVSIPPHVSTDGTQLDITKNKINAAYQAGGAPLLVETVEMNTGLSIDHYMEIGFKGIRDLTDAIGGVNICVPQDYDDEKSNLHVKAGCQEMDGVTALAYVRMRYADPKGDFGRIERQQQYLGAVMKKIARVTTVLNPIAMYRVSSAGTDSLILGKGDSVKDVVRLGIAMKGIASGKGTIASVPIADSGAMTAAGSSVLWDKAAAATLFAELGAN